MSLLTKRPVIQKKTLNRKSLRSYFPSKFLDTNSLCKFVKEIILKRIRF